MDDGHEHDGPCCDGHGKNDEQITDMVRDRIATFGYTVVMTDGTPVRAAYAYTIGVRAFVGCEFAISGAISRETMHAGLDVLAVKARDGRLTPSDGLLVENVFTGVFLPRLRLAAPGWPFGLIAAVWGTHDTPVYQAQWPSDAQHYPGDPLYDLPALAQDDYTREPRAHAAGAAFRR